MSKRKRKINRKDCFTNDLYEENRNVNSKLNPPFFFNSSFEFIIQRNKLFKLKCDDAQKKKKKEQKTYIYVFGIRGEG